MGSVHELILAHGIEGAKAFAASKAERQALEAAAAVMADEDARLGITHAGFAMTSLPHKRIADAYWRRSGGHTTLLVESGRTAKGDFIGVPYGTFARLILLYLQTEAIRTNSPEIELGRSMHAWVGRLSVAVGGKTYSLIAEQARRISACRLTFLSERGGAEQRTNGAFVQTAISLAGIIDDERQPALWQDKVRLDEGFWRSLREHPVPVREEAIKAIGARSLSIDIYVWLAYRLHALTKPTPVTWTAIHGQFGAGFKHMRQLKPKFIDALNIALAVYPEARVDASLEGLVLHPSPPAVARLQSRRVRPAGSRLDFGDAP